MSIYYIEKLKISLVSVLNNYFSKKLGLIYKVKDVKIDGSSCIIKFTPHSLHGKETIKERYEILIKDNEDNDVLDTLSESLQDTLVDVLEHTTFKCDDSTDTNLEIYSNLECHFTFDVSYTNNDSAILFQLDFLCD
jgi:hypothetical protein